MYACIIPTKTEQSHIKVRVIQSDAVKKWFGWMKACKITFGKVGVSKLLKGQLKGVLAGGLCCFGDQQ